MDHPLLGTLQTSLSCRAHNNRYCEEARFKDEETEVPREEDLHVLMAQTGRQMLRDTGWLGTCTCPEIHERVYAPSTSRERIWEHRT